MRTDGRDDAHVPAPPHSKHPQLHQHLRSLVETAVDPLQRGSILLHNPATKQNCAALIHDAMARPCAGGLSEDDVTVVPLETGAAAAAFATGQMDGVGVFAPFTTQALQREGSHVLFTSADFPGAIPDLATQARAA